MKGCKLLNIHTNSIFVSRNVVFHEHIFPFVLNNFSFSPIDHSNDTLHNSVWFNNSSTSSDDTCNHSLPIAEGLLHDVHSTHDIILHNSHVHHLPSPNINRQSDYIA
jgi:hypothetical protein